ncbi:class I SAM-dependent methyltransferase [Flavobacterium pallidum]|uniref:Nodulation protein NoeA n=1 Tax=Flavobacterium pallidum TaxID=2172098 RepID=A0A2S1SKT0_9FLAO|nr:class I SAM-dependent methyltransferase [Flavobacterium pallidum]AWI27020.1 nodulation protein NoeA [Flavobacterium pallidum]
MESNRIPSSFRDPSGYVYKDGNTIKRHITPLYFRQYESLTESGFYNALFEKKYLVRHSEISKSPEAIIIGSEKIPFISYPYEWSFLQYKHAALLTLKIQKLALENNFTLKDASAFNITFHNGKPIFIDTLSFDFYNTDEPWHAYKQFIMHFLGPLALSHYYGLDCLKTLSANIDGISLDRISALLPFKSYMNPILYTNIHLPAKYEKKHAAAEAKTAGKLTLKSQLKLIDALYSYIESLTVKQQTEWDDYYNQTNYEKQAYEQKKQLTKTWASDIKAQSVLDLGGNDGTFSRELPETVGFVIVADVDPNAVEQNYRKILKNKETKLLPLVADILNPAPAIGFHNAERFSLLDRLRECPVDACIALAVIHHITLSGNIPFDMSARLFADVSEHLLIEFPNREDSWVKFLLDSKRDFRAHFDFYNEDHFEAAYGRYFDILKKEPLVASHRTLYTMKRK